MRKCIALESGHTIELYDFIRGPELRHLLDSVPNLVETHAAFYLSQIVLALEYLETQGVVHRDLKPENILMCERGYLKLGDFGLAVKLRGSSTSSDQTTSSISRDKTTSSVGGKSKNSSGTSSLPLSSQSLAPSSSAPSTSSSSSLFSAPTSSSSSSSLPTPSSAAGEGRGGGFAGTVSYASPEMILNGSDDSVDWWALGVSNT